MDRVNIYIDGNNPHRSAKELGFQIDYKKFRGWVKQKHNPVIVYLFIGLVPEKAKFYEYLQTCGYTLIFKQTISIGEKIKETVMPSLFLKMLQIFTQTLLTLVFL